MSQVAIKEVLSSKDFELFMDVAWTINQNNPHWVPPLRLEQKELFNPKVPFFKKARVKKWLALKDGKVVGRIVGGVNEAHNEFHNEKCAFWGFFESINDLEVAKALFNTVEAYAHQEKMEMIRGPFNLSTNQECGLLIKGFDDPPQVMMIYNPPYYKDLIEACGHGKVMDLHAWRMSTECDMPERIKKISERKEKSEGITYRCVDIKNWDREVELMFNIYNDAWEKNWGFVPMSREEFIHMGKGLKMIIDPDLVVIVEVKGEAVGFLVALPDLHQALKQIPNGKLFPLGIFKFLARKKYINRMRIITLGIRKAYQNSGLAPLLYTQITKIVHEKKMDQFKEVEMSWILETNTMMNRPLELMGAEVYKNYRIFEKKL